MQYYVNVPKAQKLKQNLKQAHDDLHQLKKRHELSINSYNEHAEFMLQNIVGLADFPKIHFL